MINPYVLFDLFCVCTDDRVRVWVGPRRGFEISASWKASKIEFCKQKEQLDPNVYGNLCRH